MSNHDLKYYFKELSDALLLHYPSREAESIAYIVVEHVLNYSKFEYAGHKHELFPENHKAKWDEIKSRLILGEPIQYVVKEAHFYGLKYEVDSSVLIPRPETEELVDLILMENGQENISLIDLGTGSGCIPVSIKKNRDNWKVWALDISKEALVVAEKNASNNNVHISFIQEDILNPNLNVENQKFDIIVSNPPYVPVSDKIKMHKNVADFEPHIALFSPDEDPVKFYKAIAEFSNQHLKESGKVYVEIHEKYGNEVKKLFENGFRKVQIISDINSKPRIVKAER